MWSPHREDSMQLINDHFLPYADKLTDQTFSLEELVKKTQTFTGNENPKMSSIYDENLG